MFLAIMLVVIVLGAGMTGGSQVQASGCDVSNHYPEKVRRWCDLITRYAGDANLHPDLVAALIWQESGGNELATSHSGAVGLMQVMPRDGIAASFQCKGAPCFRNRPSTIELQDPAFNVHYGTQFLEELVNHNHGDLREALRDYGPMDVGYSYADRVLGLYQQYGR
jgi:soluble lytic murein transglycosylase-like protein